MDKKDKLTEEAFDDIEELDMDELLSDDLTRGHHHDDDDDDDDDDGNSCDNDPTVTYRDRIIFDNEPLYCMDSDDVTARVTVKPDIKIFAKKYSHLEADCYNKEHCKNGKMNQYPTEGDDIGFTLVIGNHGTKDYCAPNGSVTLEDELRIDKKVTLKLVSLSIPEGYELVRMDKGGRQGKTIEACPRNQRHDDCKDTCIFKGGRGSIQLRLKKCSCSGRKDNDNRRCSFAIDLPARSIISISMIFEIISTDTPTHCGTRDDD